MSRYIYWVDSPRGPLHVDASGPMTHDEMQAMAASTLEFMEMAQQGERTLNPYTHAKNRAIATGEKREVWPKLGIQKVVFLYRDGWINVGLWNKDREMPVGEREMILAEIGIKFNVSPTSHTNGDWHGLVYRWRPTNG